MLSFLKRRTLPSSPQRAADPFHTRHAEPLLFVAAPPQQDHLMRLSLAHHLTHPQARTVLVGLPDTHWTCFPELHGHMPQHLTAETPLDTWVQTNLAWVADLPTLHVHAESEAMRLGRHLNGKVLRPTVAYLDIEADLQQMQSLGPLRAYGVLCVLLSTGNTFDETHFITSGGTLRRHGLVGKAIRWSGALNPAYRMRARLWHGGQPIHAGEDWEVPELLDSDLTPPPPTGAAV